MSNIWNSQGRLLLETRRIAGEIDEHRRQAHRTASIPEKVELITSMSELRRTRTRLLQLLVTSVD